MNTNLKPDVSAAVDIKSALISDSGYTAPSNGYVSVQTNNNGWDIDILVNDVKVAGCHQYSGDSHGSENKQLFTIVGQGQVVNANTNNISYNLAIFVPYV